MCIDTMICVNSDINTDLTLKVTKYRNENKKLTIEIEHYKKLAKETEAFIETILVDSKWEKRLISASLGRIMSELLVDISNLSDRSTDKVSPSLNKSKKSNHLDSSQIIRHNVQIAQKLSAVLKLIHNSAVTPLVFILNERDEDECIQNRPFETIHDILKGKFDCIDLMKGYQELFRDYHNNFGGIPIDSNGSSEGRIRNWQDSESKDKTASESLDTSVNSDQNAILYSSDITHSDVSLKLMDLTHKYINDTISDYIQRYSREYNDLKESKHALSKQLENLREYAMELQTYTEKMKKSLNDELYELRVANELLNIKLKEDQVQAQQYQSYSELYDKLQEDHKNLLIENEENVRKYERLTNEYVNEKFMMNSLVTQITSQLNNSTQEFLHHKQEVELLNKQRDEKIERLMNENNDLGNQVNVLQEELLLLKSPMTSIKRSMMANLTGIDTRLASGSTDLIDMLGQPESPDCQAVARGDTTLDDALIIEGLTERIQELENEIETQSLFHEMKVNSLYDEINELKSQMHELSTSNSSICDELNTLNKSIELLSEGNGLDNNCKFNDDGLSLDKHKLADSESVNFDRTASLNRKEEESIDRTSIVLEEEVNEEITSSLESTVLMLASSNDEIALATKYLQDTEVLILSYQRRITELSNELKLYKPVNT